jgi:hypothetical protein
MYILHVDHDGAMRCAAPGAVGREAGRRRLRFAAHLACARRLTVLRAAAFCPVSTGTPSGWCYRLKQDFLFKYDALEDELAA